MADKEKSGETENKENTGADMEEVKKAMEAQKEQKEQKHAGSPEKADKERSKIDELTEDLQRVQAEFENYKKRTEKENAKLCDYNKAELIKKLLTVLDSFEIALKNSENHEEFVKGMELIYSQLYTMLKDEGLQYIDTKGKKFDPYFHEVMLSEKSDEPEDTILEELQKGYKFKELMLRHSKVKVAKK